jgi:transposase
MDAPVNDLLDGSSPPPSCPHCAELQAEVDALRQQVRELQARLDQNSGNSSKPPSSDPPHLKSKLRDGQKRRRRGKPGGRPGHTGHHRKLLPPQRVDHVIDHLPHACRSCGSCLAAEARPADPQPRRHQVAEIPPLAAVVTEHRAHGRLCSCGQVTFASLPDGVRDHCFGPRLAALVSYLSARCHDGKRTVRELLDDVFGVPISLGSISAREREVAAALRRPYAQAQRSVRRAAVKHVDETGWSDRGRPCWLWVAATAKAALFRIHRRRTAKALQRLLGKPGDRRSYSGDGGILVTDRAGCYGHWPPQRRQVCWAHLQRDFRRFDEQGLGLGRQGLAVCRQVFGLWRDFRQGTRKREELAEAVLPLRKRLRNVLMWWRDDNRRRQGKPQKFARNLLACEAALWTFANAQQQGPQVVEPTNNHAERMLRPAVLWRKNCFGSQGGRGRRFTERVLTVVQTLRLRGKGVLDYLCRAVEALRAGSTAPRLLYG